MSTHICGQVLTIPNVPFHILLKLRWLFRHLLQFLRDGSLPDDRPLLAQLYREAAFFHLNEMQKAIEEEKVGVFGVGVLFFISLHSYR